MPWDDGQWVICWGKVTITMAKPSMAGLNGFLPTPPYKCLPNNSAKAAALTVSHHGQLGGNASASSVALTRALPSLKVGWMGRLRSCNTSASTVSAVTPVRIRLINTPQPYHQNNTSSPGTVASNTCFMAC
ncbi:hypothetical protein D3C85_1412810 [compost metagenome]